MKTIEINFRPVSWLPLKTTVNSCFPQNWGEVDTQQLLAIVKLGNNTISELKFLSRLSGLKITILKRMDQFQLYKLMELPGFIGQRNPHHAFIIPTLSVRHCPVLYSPSPKLKGVTLGQFIFADSYFAGFLESGHPDDLNKFIASLYLGKNEKFEERLIRQRYQNIGRLNSTIREAILLNYQLIQEWLALAYPLIFQTYDLPVSEKTRIPKPGPRNTSPWLGIFRKLVGDDILHDEQWADKPVNTIFTYLTRKYKENARTRK